ncbi:hypothetical protein [uncultured Sulfitobacter sp.]|uniref:hypothetical protein n=1 Tax=uncultured Sulfitobacter sp. TaxID=191468 RepID=UPI00261A7C86|nr:hypothetical protein [uncultured Sulfitobacter sp.]
MTRKTQPSAWTAKRWVAIAAVCAAVVFAIGVALSPSRATSVAIIGDQAEELRVALGTVQSNDPTVTIVLLRRWENLRHLPDIAELCWDACHYQAAAQITLTQMRFGATRKVVVFHLPDFEDDLTCVARRARHEMLSLRAQVPSCQIKAARLPVWILPMGLGRIS